MYLGAAVSRIFILDKLVFRRRRALTLTVPAAGRIKDCFVEHGLGEKLLLVNAAVTPHGIHHPVLKVVFGASAGLSEGVEFIPLYFYASGHAVPGYLALMNAGTTQSLHSQHDAFQSGRFAGPRSAYQTAAEEVYYRCYPGGELSRQCFNRPFRDTAFRRSPLWRLGYAVFCTHNVGFYLIEAYSMGSYIILVISAFLYPSVDYCQLQGGIGVAAPESTYRHEQRRRSSARGRYIPA